MTKDLKIMAIFSVSISLWFLFNPVQETEIAIKLKELCMASQIPCEEVEDYCLESLQKGYECYLIK